MKELDTLIKTVAEGLKSMAQGVEKLAAKVETISKSLPADSTRAKAKPAKKAKTAAPAAKKVSRKSPAAKDKPVTAANTVLAIIKRSKKGVDTNTLIQKTGYDRKKVANIVYKLKKQGHIKTSAKGVYLKA
jgi:hypothetical protein